jgi:hypothetical protein
VVITQIYFRKPELYANLETEWLDSFALACRKLKKPVVDVSVSWQPFLPGWYNKTHVIDPSLPGTNSSVPQDPSTTNTTFKTLSSAAIAGIAIVCTVVFIVFIVMVVVHIRTRRKASRKSAEVAVLQDQLSPDGFTNRINQIWRSQNDSFSTPSSRSARSPPTEYPLNDLAFRPSLVRNYSRPQDIGAAKPEYSPYAQRNSPPGRMPNIANQEHDHNNDTMSMATTQVSNSTYRKPITSIDGMLHPAYRSGSQTYSDQDRESVAPKSRYQGYKHDGDPGANGAWL